MVFMTFITAFNMSMLMNQARRELDSFGRLIEVAQQLSNNELALAEADGNLGKAINSQNVAIQNLAQIGTLNSRMLERIEKRGNVIRLVIPPPEPAPASLPWRGTLP